MKLFKVFFLSTLIFFLWTNQKALAQVDKPVVLETTLLKAAYGDQIMINGLTQPKSLVLIYINGTYYGFAKNSTNDPEIDNFSYLSPVIKNNPSHEYKVIAISKNPESFELSPATERAVLSIIEPSSLAAVNKPQPDIIKPNNNIGGVKKVITISAPTLITPTGNIGEYKPIISGFSKNQTKVKLFIDNILETDFWVLDQESGTANFRYTTVKELSRGVHFAYAVATDKNNITSKKSNFLYFYIADPKYLATSTSLSQEKNSSSTSLKTEEITSSTKELEKIKVVNSALNISLLILFVVGMLIWVITTSKHSIEELESKKNKDKK